MKLKMPLLVVAAVVVAFLAHAAIRSRSIPKPIYQPFASFGDSWETPPLAAGDYSVVVEYLANEPDRLGAPLAVTVTDQTTGAEVASEGRPLTGTYDGWESVVVGEFHAMEGHRYEIKANPEQVAKLAKWHHRLAVELTAAERNNRAMRALFAW